MNLKIKRPLIIILITINLLLGNSFSLSNNGDGTWDVRFEATGYDSNQKVTIIIYDMTGRKVTTLYDGDLGLLQWEKKYGDTYKVTWDATTISTGTYFVQMKSGFYSHTQKLLLVPRDQITSPQVQAQSAFNNLERKTIVNKKNEAGKPKYNSNPNYQENNNSYEPFAEGSVVFVDNFKSLGVEEFESEILRTELESALQQLKIWKITERGEVEKILREQKFQHSGCTDTECAVKIGQFLNADYIVTGQAGKLGSQYSLAIKLIDVESAEIKRSKTSQAKDLGEFLNKLPMIAKELTEK